jgi:hypothetical protein
VLEVVQKLVEGYVPIAIGVKDYAHLEEIIDLLSVI